MTRDRRTRGTGCIIKKPNSRFLYIAFYDSNGKQITESTKSPSRSVAEAQLRKRLQEVSTGVPVEVSRKLKYEHIRASLIADYKDRKVRMLEDDGGKPYVWGFEHLDPFFGGKLVRNITTDTLRGFVKKRREAKAAPATINRNLALLRKMMNLARKEGKIQVVPFFPMQKEDNVRQGFVERDKFADIFSRVPDGLKPLLLFLYYTGCRIGAAEQITWEMVNPNATEITIPGNITKNKEPIVLPLPAELTTMLKKEFRRDSSPVFSTLNLRREWGKAIKAAGVPDLILHDLRRSGIRNLINAGVPETVAMKISGHKTASVFRRYAIVSTQDIRNAMLAVEKNNGRMMEVGVKGGKGRNARK